MKRGRPRVSVNYLQPLLGESEAVSHSDVPSAFVCAPNPSPHCFKQSRWHISAHPLYLHAFGPDAKLLAQ